MTNECTYCKKCHHPSLSKKMQDYCERSRIQEKEQQKAFIIVVISLTIIFSILGLIP